MEKQFKLAGQHYNEFCQKGKWSYSFKMGWKRILFFQKTDERPSAKPPLITTATLRVSTRRQRIRIRNVEGYTSIGVWPNGGAGNCPQIITECPRNRISDWRAPRAPYSPSRTRIIVASPLNHRHIIFTNFRRKSRGSSSARTCKRVSSFQVSSGKNR